MTEYQFRLLVGFLLLFAGGFFFVLKQLWTLYENHLTFRDALLEIIRKQNEMSSGISYIKYTLEKNYSYTKDTYSRCFDIKELADMNKKFTKKNRKLFLERLDVINYNLKRDAEL